jgi:hypothetical protein
MSDTMTLEQSQPTAGLPPAGWYADPAADSLLRWWGGLAWTDHTRAVVTAPVSPPIATPAYGFKPLVSSYIPAGSSGHDGWENGGSSTFTAHAPGSGNTRAIWFLITLPLFSFALALAQITLLVTPLLGLIGSLLLLTSVVVAAFADRSALIGRGLPSASPAWLLLSVPVFLVRRRVVLKRAGVRSNAPGNVFVVIVVLGSIGYGMLAFHVFTARLDTAAVHQLESQASTELARQSKVSWTVACPADAPASTVGASFTCDATSATGQKVAIVATVVSADRFTVKLVNPAASTAST